MKIHIEYIFGNYSDTLTALTMDDGDCICSLGKGDRQFDGLEIYEGTITIEPLKTFTKVIWEAEVDEDDIWISPYLFENFMTFDSDGKELNGEASKYEIISDDICEQCKFDPEHDNKYDCSLCSHNYDSHFENK